MILSAEAEVVNTIEGGGSKAIALWRPTRPCKPLPTR
jgi:hypothetical protein